MPRIRRQEFPELFIGNGAIYAAKRDVVVDKKSFFGDSCSAYVMGVERSVNVDTPFDC